MTRATRWHRARPAFVVYLDIWATCAWLVFRYQSGRLLFWFALRLRPWVPPEWAHRGSLKLLRWQYWDSAMVRHAREPEARPMTYPLVHRYPAATYKDGWWWPVLETAISGDRPLRLTKKGAAGFSSHGAALAAARDILAHLDAAAWRCLDQYGPVPLDPYKPLEPEGTDAQEKPAGGDAPDGHAGGPPTAG